MKILFTVFIISLICLVSGFSHLCNDVFMQAKDNLAVKVDTRDGQLRISQKGNFRVYLMNTMDRAIENIQLEVLSKDFEALVKPSDSWATFPILYKKGPKIKSEYFEVELVRKPNVAEGKYQIGLRLFDGSDSTREYKTVNVGDALSTFEMPKITEPIKIDGEVSSTEWQNSYLCSSLYEYKYIPVRNAPEIQGQFINKDNPDIQTRVRFCTDQENLFCMIDFQKSGTNDIAKLYIAASNGGQPLILEANLQSNTVSDGNNTIKPNFSFNNEKLEIQLPFKSLGIDPKAPLYLNVSRSKNNKVTYWRGNKLSVREPMIFGQFVLKP